MTNIIQPNEPDPRGAESPVGADSTVATSSELESLLAVLRGGLLPDADPQARAMAGDLCMRLGYLLMQSLAPAPGVAPAAYSVAPQTMPTAPTAPRRFSPLTAVVDKLRHLPPGALRNVPREQLVDLALHGLRAALPPGTTVTEPKGIQFPLVPVPPPLDKP